MNLAVLTCLCCLLSGVIHWLSRRQGWVVQRRLGRKRFPIPPTSEGGAAFLLGFLVCLAASYSHLNQDLLLSPSEMRSRHIGLAVTLIGVWAAGRWVDRKGHAHLWNIVALTAGALILAGSGFLIHTIRIGSSVHDLGWVSVPATVLWLVIISEMFRLFDGLDGILVLLVMAAIAVQLLFVLPEEEGYARALCGSALPALAGLLPWRIYPARMELRGIGAFLPGFVFGAITLVGREKAFTTKAVVLPTLAAIIVFSLFCLWLLEQHLFLPKQKK